MNRCGLNNISPAFWEIESDSLTNGEIDWSDKYENDIYLHNLLNFVNHYKKQGNKSSNNPYLSSPNHTVSRLEPSTKKRRGWAAFFRRNCNKTLISSVIYVEHEPARQSNDFDISPSVYKSYEFKDELRSVSAKNSVRATPLPLPPCKEQITVKTHLLLEDELFLMNSKSHGLCREEQWDYESSDFKDELTSAPVKNSITLTPPPSPSCKEQLTVKTHLLFDDESFLMKLKSHGFRRDELLNVSYVADDLFYSYEDNSSVCFTPAEKQESDGLFAPIQWMKDWKRRRHRRSDEIFCGSEINDYGVF